MKKVFSLSLLVFLVISGIFVMNTSVEGYVAHVLYKGKTEVSLVVRDDADRSELTEDIERVAVGDTSVSQYFLTGENRLDIYSANPSFPVTGDIPHGGCISNRSRSGPRLLVPDIGCRVSLFSFDRIRNAGFNEVFYVSGDVERVCSVLRRFGKVRIRNDVDETLVRDDDGTPILLMTVPAAVSLLSLAFILLKQKRRVDLMKLLGRRRCEAFTESVRDVFSPLAFSVVSSGVILVAYAIQRDMVDYCMTFTPSLLVLYVLVVLFFLLFSGFSGVVHYGRRMTLAGKPEFSRAVMVASSVFFIAGVLLTTVMLPEVHRKYDCLRSQAAVLRHWSSAGNLYQTNLTNQIDRMDNSVEVEYDLRAMKLWKKMRTDYRTFVVFSNNLLWTYGEDGQYRPWYRNNPDNKTEADYICSVSGHSMTADVNYLRLSKTKLADGGKLSELRPGPSERILIVPEKYRKYETKIRRNYRNEFLFQAGSDFVRWKKVLHVPELTGRNLKIRIVYARDNQDYFTYNPDSGDSLLTNLVKDPVIVLFDDHQNSLSYGNLFCLNGGFFFFDDHAGSVYERLRPCLERTGMGSEINFVTSVYSRKAEIVERARRDAITGAVRLVSCVACVFLSLVLLVGQYYLMHEREIVIRRLMGHSVWKIMFGPLLLAALTFAFGDVVSICLMRGVDAASLLSSALMLAVVVVSSLLMIMNDIGKYTRKMGRDS